MAEERKSEARVQKEAHVEEIKELIKNCNGMVVVSYQGISVADVHNSEASSEQKT